MNVNLFLVAISGIITAIFAMATSSLATNCFNVNEKYKEENKDSFNYIIVNLVSNILMILISIGSIYMSVK